MLREDGRRLNRGICGVAAGILACRGAGLPSPAEKTTRKQPARWNSRRPPNHPTPLPGGRDAALHVRPGRLTPPRAIVCSQLWADLRFNPVVQDTNHSSARPHWLQVVLIGRRPRATLARIVVLVAVCVVTFKFVLLPIRVEGISMEPTYHDRRVNCVNRLAYWRHAPQRGDVVAIRFSDPGEFSAPRAMLMKRIIGLPGESVSFRGWPRLHQRPVAGRALCQKSLRLGTCTHPVRGGPVLCGGRQPFHAL